MNLTTLVFRTDTTATRFTLGLGGALWALSLWYPGNTFDRPVYEFLKFAAPEPAWAVAWSVYSFLVLLHLFKDDCHPYWGVLIDSVGLVLWAFSSFAIVATIGFPVSAAASAGIALTCAAFWILVRSHLTGGRMRGD